MNMRHLFPLLTLAMSALACSEEPPAVPTWDLHVYPILRGSCGHCHGVTADVPKMGTSAFTPGSRYDICSSEPFNAAFMNERLAIAGTDNMGRPIVGGAGGGSAGVIANYVKPSFQLRMPPPPASPLSDYEQTVLQRWVDVSKASCAKQTPNRKPEMKVVSMPAPVAGSNNKVAVTIEVIDPDGDQAYGYAKIGNAAPQVIPGAGRYRFEFDNVRATDPLTVKLHDGYDAFP
jgi:hypothetical protein